MATHTEILPEEELFVEDGVASVRPGHILVHLADRDVQVQVEVQDRPISSVSGAKERKKNERFR